MPSNRKIRTLARAHGIFYAATGIWPILHLRSFEAVTGPKKEGWLVRTVGALVGVVGGVLVASARRERGPSGDLVATAVGCALSLTAIDITYVAKGRIAPVYLLDAVAELGLVTAWCILWKPESERAKNEASAEAGG